MRSIGDFTSVSLYARDNLNPYMFIYAYSVALLHRPDTRDVPLPPLSEVFPDKFVGGGVFGRIKEEVSVADVGLRVRNAFGLLSEILGTKRDTICEKYE
jgi:hypothetical protein